MLILSLVEEQLAYQDLSRYNTSAVRRCMGERAQLPVPSVRL